MASLDFAGNVLVLILSNALKCLVEVDNFHAVAFEMNLRLPHIMSETLMPLVIQCMCIFVQQSKGELKLTVSVDAEAGHRIPVHINTIAWLAGNNSPDGIPKLANLLSRKETKA